MLSQVEDKSRVLLFPIGGLVFAAPCPSNCGSVTLAPESISIDREGHLITSCERDISVRAYILMPHNPDNSHDDGDEDEPLS